MANTFTKIASVTVGSGGASTVDFSSIPSTYTDLAVYYSIRGSSNESGDGHNPYFKFNNNTSNYSWIMGYGNGSSALKDSGTSNLLICACPSSDFTANTFSNGLVYIPNYTSSNYKVYYRDSTAENNGASSYTVFNARLWSNTSAINQITFYPITGTFVQYSSATLYGIKNS